MSWETTVGQVRGQILSWQLQAMSENEGELSAQMLVQVLPGSLFALTLVNLSPMGVVTRVKTSVARMTEELMANITQALQQPDVFEAINELDAVVWQASIMGIMSHADGTGDQW